MKVYFEIHGMNCSIIGYTQPITVRDYYEADDWIEKYLMRTYGVGAYNSGCVSYKMRRA